MRRATGEHLQRVAEVWYGDVPPSLNVLGVRGNPREFHRAKKQWQGIVEFLFLATDMPRGMAKVEVHATVRFPSWRRRDTGNYSAMLEKVVGDALVNGRWLVDDTADRYSLTLGFDPDRGPKRTTITVAQVTDAGVW